MNSFSDRRYNLGQEKQYQITRADGSTEIVDIEKLGIEEEGTRISAATLNPIVNHVNDPDLHVPRTQYNALELRVQTLENQLANDLRNNNFAFDFSSTEGLFIDAGWIDASKGWLVIK